MGTSFQLRLPRTPELDQAFESAQKAVEEADKKGERGVVFCQIGLVKEDGEYNIRGAFYPHDKALLIQEALIESNKK